jgi:predicted metal-binding protein
MGKRVKVGIVICGRYGTCAGGKCFRALREREGAFAAYAGQEVELVGSATCSGCPAATSSTPPTR